MLFMNYLFWLALFESQNSLQVWYRVIQIVINRDDIQGYAAKTVFEALQSPSCHENMVKVGGYILGEFGNLIAGDPRSR